MRVEAMSEIQARPWLGEVEVCDCGIWSFSFLFFFSGTLDRKFVTHLHYRFVPLAFLNQVFGY